MNVEHLGNLINTITRYMSCVSLYALHLIFHIIIYISIMQSMKADTALSKKDL